MPDDDFSTAPSTIGELRAEKTSKGKDWKPRDVLINLLRDIDSGDRNVTDLVIFWREPVPENGNHAPHYLQSCSDPYAAIGMVHVCTHQFIADALGED